VTALLPPAEPATRPPARRTSVPVWPAQAPDLDPAGTSFLLVQVGAGAADVVRGWAAQAQRHGRPAQVWCLPRVDEGTPAELTRRLGTFRVGARFMVAGPEADVLPVAATARAVGLVPEEITAFAVGRDDISVFCVHCETTSRVAAGPGTELTCPGCRRRLEVHEHVSGHRGSYLASATAAPAPGGER
jgi:hypothetical protein